MPRRKRPRCIADLNLPSDFFRPDTERERIVLRSIESDPVTRINHLCKAKLRHLRDWQHWVSHHSMRLYRKHEETKSDILRRQIRFDMDRLAIADRELCAAVSLKSFGELMYLGFTPHPADEDTTNEPKRRKTHKLFSYTY